MDPASNASVKTLTKRLARGDREAFATFYQDWFDRMYTEARRATGRDESFCLDVVHDAMLRVIHAIRPIDNETALAAWVRTVVRTSAYDLLRKERRRQRRERAAYARRAPTVADSDRALADRLAWLRREILNGNVSNRSMFLLRYRLGWTFEHIGSVLGMTPGAVAGRIARMTAMLRKRARESFDE